ncbi:hypothetical protein FI667_g7911, partial [Globisporangium splendens]
MHGSHTNHIGEEHSPTIAVSVDVCEDVEVKAKDREAKLLRTPLKTKHPGTPRQKSPRSAPKSFSNSHQNSPRMVNAVNDILPTVMVINNEIIVEDDDEELAKREGKTKRARVSTTPKTQTRKKESSSSSSEDDSDSSSGSDGDDGDGTSRGVNVSDKLHKPRAATREIAAKEREDARAKANGLKRPSSSRNLWLTSFQDAVDHVKTEPKATTDSILRTNGQNELSDSERDDFGVTTEEHSEEFPVVGSPISILVAGSATTGVIKTQKPTTTTSPTESKKTTSSSSRPKPKRTPPKSLMDMRLEQAQAALDAEDEEEKKNKEIAMRRATWHSRRTKILYGRSFKPHSPIPGPNLSEFALAVSRTLRKVATKKPQPNSSEEESDNEEMKVPAEDEEEIIPRVRRPFCMMRAGTRALAVQRKTRAFQEMDQPSLLVRAPKKFAELQHAGPLSVSEIELPSFDPSGAISHSMLRISDAGTLPVSGMPLPSVVLGSAHSSSDFSLNSWFKKKVSPFIVDFMAEEEPGGARNVASNCFQRLPLYAVRQPPLVQPLEISPFAERTLEKYGLRDLGHEWVTLFQAIGGISGGYSKSMKLQIPDTILLSPNGQPSMWYSTSASSHIKPRHLMRVTSQIILEEFTEWSSAASLENEVIAVRRVGFRVENMTLNQLQEFCREMERPRVAVHRHEWEEVDDDEEEVARDSQSKSFCLQKYVEPHRNSVRDNVSDKHYARSFYKRPFSLLSSDVLSKCDLFLFKTERDGVVESDENTGVADEGDDERLADGFDEETDEKPTVSLVHLNLESQSLFEDSLSARGFDKDAIVPQLYHMKLTASEILNRLNRSLHARQVSAIGVAVNIPGDDPKFPRQLVDTATRVCQHPTELRAIRSALRRRKHRFASLQRAESSISFRPIPVYISPRYIGAVVPKNYRDGKFHSLLAPKQANSVNRLHLSPRPPLTLIQHPLSKQYTKMDHIGSDESRTASPRKTKHKVKKDMTQDVNK